MFVALLSYNQGNLMKIVAEGAKKRAQEDKQRA